MRENIEENKDIDDFGMFKKEHKLLQETLLEIESSDLGKIDFNGNSYTKVSKRIEVFRKNFGFNVRIITDVTHMDDIFVLLKATISVIKNGVWHEVATGYAEERRDSNEINRFSAIENAETSAIGRALACLGISGDEYASVDELVIALAQQSKNQESKKQEPVKNTKIVNISESNISYIVKLLKETKTVESEFIGYYGVKDIRDLSSAQGANAVTLLKRKISKIKALKESDSKGKEENEALSVLKENNEVKFKSIEATSGDEEVKTHSLDQINTKIETKDETPVVETKDETPVVETKDETPVVETKDETPVVETKDETSVVETKDETSVVETKDKTSVVETKDETLVEKPKETKKKTTKKRVKKSKEPEKREEVGNNLSEDDEILF